LVSAHLLSNSFDGLTVGLIVSARFVLKLLNAVFHSNGMTPFGKSLFFILGEMKLNLDI
jgi:hypothetical protein